MEPAIYKGSACYDEPVHNTLTRTNKIFREVTVANFDYEIIYVKSKENRRADALSRSLNHSQEILEVQAQTLHFKEHGNMEQQTIAAMFTLDRSDPRTVRIKDFTKNWASNQYPEEVTLDQGCPTINEKIWVPKELQNETIKTAHEHPLRGHRGIRKPTAARI
jgi:hypothetical protein